MVDRLLRLCVSALTASVRTESELSLYESETAPTKANLFCGYNLHFTCVIVELSHKLKVSKVLV